MECAGRKMTRRLTIFGRWIALAALAMSGWCACAQEKPDSPEPTKATAAAQTPAITDTKAKDTDKEANDEVPKRIFWIIPNFMTANDQPQNLGPLTPKEKFNIAWHQWWDVSAHVGNVLQAAISQAANGIPEYGQGWGAFGERYAAQEGDQFTGATVICRTDSGENTFNIPQVFGQLGQASISLTYYPQVNQTLAGCFPGGPSTS